MFQLLPNTRGVLGVGYRVDPITQSIEDEVDNALPYRLRFHKISKLVIALGPAKNEKDYIEALGVAQKQYPDFDIYAYKAMSDAEKITTMRRVILEVFDWLIVNFQDSDCFRITKEKLKWS